MSDFSITYQKELLSILLNNLEAALTYRYIIGLESFESMSLNIISGVFFSYLDKYRSLPKPRTLWHKIKYELRKYVGDEQVESTTKKLLVELYKLKVHDQQYVLDVASHFAEIQAWKDVITDSLDLIDNGNCDELFDKCLNAREKGIITLPYDPCTELDDRLDRLKSTVESGLVKTGIKHFDEHVRIYAPTYSLFIGDSGKGKTWFLLHLARAAMYQGYNVVFFTGEMTPDMLSLRFDGGMLGINTELFYEHSVHNRLKDLLKDKYKKLKGSMTMVPFVAGEYSVSELDSDIRRFCLRAEGPVVVLIDYIDLLSYKDSTRRGLNETEKQKLVSQAIQGITMKNKIVTWAAGTMLTKREHSNGKMATRTAKAGAGDIVYTTDFYWTLNQTHKQKDKNLMYLYNDKSRHQEGNWVIGIKTDFARSRFCRKSVGAIQKSVLESKMEKKKNG